jgi:hypothetical protein
MPNTRVKTANFGITKAGLGTVGYTLFDVNGVEVSSRSSVGVYEVGLQTGIYGANISFPDQFNGTILWDTGQGDSSSFASEEQNFSDSAISLTSDLEFVKDMIGGKWQIDHENFQMIFYKGDNVTEVARFDLKDKNDNPSFLSVFHRNRVA